MLLRCWCLTLNYVSPYAATTYVVFLTFSVSQVDSSVVTLHYMTATVSIKLSASFQNSLKLWRLAPLCNSIRIFVPICSVIPSRFITCIDIAILLYRIKPLNTYFLSERFCDIFNIVYCYFTVSYTHLTLPTNREV